MRKAQTGKDSARTGPGDGGGVRPRAVIAGLLAADVAFAYQRTSIGPAVHDVEQSLDASPQWAAWLVTVYLIVATIVTPAMGRLADLQSSSSFATQGVSQDVAAASSALNSTIRRFAGGTGGQVTTILLASYPVINTGRPRFPAFTPAFLIAAGFCVAGAALIVAFGRNGRKTR